MVRRISLLAVAVALTAGPAHAAFPGDNGRILYTTYPGTQVVSVNPDGSDPQVLANGRAGHWSPDGRRIAYTNANNVWLMAANGAGKQQITFGKVVNSLDWAPDGQRLLLTVYDSLSGASGRIEVIGLDGGVHGTIAPVPSGASWSPDGKLIAYTSGTQVQIVAADGSGPRGSFPGVYPEWSPDGERIVFSGPGPSQDIYTAKPDGTDQVHVTSSSSLADQWATYSPDGTRVTFLRVDQNGISRVVEAAVGGGDEHDVATGGALLPHWQPKRRPIVFVPGFAASEIECSTGVLWLDEVFPPLGDMKLSADGASNDAGTPCSASAQPSGSLLLAPFGQPIGTGITSFLQEIAPDDHTMFAWDWRKSPTHAVPLLDAAVEQARCGGATPPCADPIDKVVLMGHSMGGLVIRAYLDDPARAAKVVRAVTVGTPYWGSPKAIFPLAAGIEAPHHSSLDAVLDNTVFHEFARNLAGLYTLYPSGNYGSWLTLLNASTTPVDRAGLLAYVDDAGGNSALLSTALDLHSSTLDGFETNGVDYQVVAGAGRNTITEVFFNPLSLVTDGVTATYGNGDETVPLRSAVQGTPGGNPLGEDVPIHFACNVGHVDLINDRAVTDRLRPFLLGPFPVKPGPGPCGSGGFQMSFAIELARRGTRTDTSSLEAAEMARKVQVLDTGAKKLVITDDGVPAEFGLSATRFTLKVTRIDNGAKGAEVEYGPLTGAIVVKAGTSLRVFQNGVELRPGPPDPAAPPADPTTTAGTESAAATPIATAVPPTATVARLTALRVSPSRFRAARRGGSVAPTGPARVTYALTAAGRVRFSAERRVRSRGHTIYRVVKGSFTHSGRGGGNALRFTGRLAGRRLAAGSYRLVARGPLGVRRAAFTVRR